MGTRKFELSISFVASRKGRPWKVDIPASIAKRRRRQFFTTRRKAQEFADDYAEAALRGGAVSALEGQTVREAFERYMEAKATASSRAHNEKIRFYGKRVVEVLGSIRVAGLNVRDVERYLNRQTWGARTRWNALGYLSSFLAWCQRRDYIERNPARLVAEEVTKPQGRKEILTVEEMRLLLGLTRRDPVMRAFVAFGAFAGLRSIEMLRMDWSDVNLEEREIHIRPEVIKRTRGVRERYVTVNSTLLRWMPKNGRGRMIPHTQRAFQRRSEQLRKRMQRVMKRLGVSSWERWKEWPHNCLRHSFASYLLAIKQDAGNVAYQMGHTSPTMVHQSYRIVGSGDERHLRAGVCWEALESEDAAFRYAAEHAAKPHQKSVPLDYQSVGRFWGRVGPVKLVRGGFEAMTTEQLFAEFGSEAMSSKGRVKKYLWDASNS